MPQAAQQDYIKIKSFGLNDYRMTLELKKAIERGTIFDVIISIHSNRGYQLDVRVLSVVRNSEANTTAVGVSFDNGTPLIDVSYSTRQYEGLVAIQNAHKSDEGAYARPVILITRGYPGDDEPYIYLGDSEADDYICVDDKLLICTLDGEGLISSIEVSDITEEGELGHINISWEDAQKLIGLPIS